MAGRVLVRFLKSAQDAQAQDQVVSLKSEIAFLQYAAFSCVVVFSSSELGHSTATCFLEQESESL